MVLERARAHVGAVVPAPGLHVGAGHEQALGAAERERARRLRQLDVEAAEDAEAHAAPDERRLERGARREHRLLAVEEVRLVVDGEQLAVRREDDGGVEDGCGARSGRRRLRRTAEARQAGDEAHARLAGHPPERLEARPVEGLRELAHALGREAGEDVLGEHDEPGARRGPPPRRLRRRRPGSAPCPRPPGAAGRGRCAGGLAAGGGHGAILPPAPRPGRRRRRPRRRTWAK